MRTLSTLVVCVIAIAALAGCQTHQSAITVPELTAPDPTNAVATGGTTAGNAADVIKDSTTKIAAATQKIGAATSQPTITKEVAAITEQNKKIAALEDGLRKSEGALKTAVTQIADMKKEFNDKINQVVADANKKIDDLGAVVKAKDAEIGDLKGENAQLKKDIKEKDNNYVRTILGIILGVCAVGVGGCVAAMFFVPKESVLAKVTIASAAGLAATAGLCVFLIMVMKLLLWIGLSILGVAVVTAAIAFLIAFKKHQTQQEQKLTTQRVAIGELSQLHATTLKMQSAEKRETIAGTGKVLGGLHASLLSPDTVKLVNGVGAEYKTPEMWQ